MKKEYIVLLLILTIPLVYADPYSVDSSGNCATGKNGVKIGSLCYDCGESDGICPEYASSGVCSTTDPDCCQVTGIKWLDSSGSEITSASNGQSVTLELTAGTGCAGQTVSFDIWESDLTNDDDYSPDPSSATIASTGKASTTWSADGTFDDGVGSDPEFYFFAQIGSQTSYGPSNLLEVSSSGAATTTTQETACGNGMLETGETAANCPEDAGGDKGATCDDQNKCMQGLVCTSGTCECVTDQKDSQFPPFHSQCLVVDPDYDWDDDGIIGGDNCPVISNPEQEDNDLDGFPADASGNALCDFSASPFVTGSGYSCGGDACDSDDDNDGVCDAGLTNPDCSGSDLCPGTPQTTDLADIDSDGCSSDQKSCLQQWDCSQTSWSDCDTSTNTITRIGTCVFTGETGSFCADSQYEPENTKSCILEEEFPVFSLMNVIVTLMLISGFYILRRK
ncbi:MAG: hypothetical protein Q8R00_00350 [Candidatus Nanoarchaeia archaeon]|nr:hypothetical protein [Candidatus Nanoarchaeia archaeon]